MHNRTTERKEAAKLTGEVLLHSNRNSPKKKKAAFRLDRQGGGEEEDLPLGYINLDVFDVLLSFELDLYLRTRREQLSTVISENFVFR